MIKCLLETSNFINKKGLNTIVNKYSTKTGDKITEVITDLDNKSKGVRTIHQDFANNIEKIEDKVFGRIETYYPAQSGIIQVSKDGTKTFFPEQSIKNLAKY